MEKLVDHLSGFISKNRNARFDQILNFRTNHFAVAVEDVYQLHNTSAVIRSCDVFGIQNVHIIEERNRKKIDREIAMGSQKWVDIHRYTNVSACMDNMRTQGYRIIATSPHKENSTIDNFDFTPKSCFFFGSEGEGLSEEVLNQADDFITIPMVGFTESLNISVSAAIILQTATSFLRKSNVEWALSESEKLNLKLKWIKKTLKSADTIIKRYELSM